MELRCLVDIEVIETVPAKLPIHDVLTTIAMRAVCLETTLFNAPPKPCPVPALILLFERWELRWVFCLTSAQSDRWKNAIIITSLI